LAKRTLCVAWKILFYNIGRTGSTSAQQFLINNFDGERPPEDAFRLSPDQEDDYFKFTFVRNPYSRVLSLMNYICYKHRPHLKLSPRESCEDRDTLAIMMDAGELDDTPPDLMPTQTKQLEGLQLDKICRFEHFTVEILSLPFVKEFERKWRRVPPIPHINRTQAKKNWERNLTPTVIEVTNMMYHEDFQNFGYKMVSP